MEEWKYSSVILDLGARWRSVVSFRTYLLYSRRYSHYTHWKGGWVGPRATPNATEKRKFLLMPGIETGLPPRGPSLY
jgi:hypothetical protein